MIITKRGLLATAAGLAVDPGLRRLRAQTTKMRFGVGPLLPSPTDTIKVYTPIFDHLAKQLGVEVQPGLNNRLGWHGRRDGVRSTRPRLDGSLGLHHCQ